LNAEYDNVVAKIIVIVTALVKDDILIGEETGLQSDVGMASLQVMELILEIEDEFDISFPLNRLPDIQTIRDLSQEVLKVLQP
jgi:acyl carrier protein